MLIGSTLALLARLVLPVLILPIDGSPRLGSAPLLAKQASSSVRPVNAVTATDGATARANERRISEVTVFLLGGGLAVLIALLAWGEQIRAIAKDTRDLKNDFLNSRGLTRVELLPILNSKNPTDQLLALTRLMASGKLKTAPEVEVIGCFQEWGVLAARLASRLSVKYWLTTLLAVDLFAEGAISGFLDLRSPGVRGESAFLLLMVVPAGLFVSLLVALVAGARAEKSLNKLLEAIAERV